MGQHLFTTVGQDRAFMQVVDGKPVDSLSGERLDVVCPSDGKVFASVPRAGAAGVDRAVQAARRAFDEGPWARMPAVERGRILTRLGLLVEKNGEELAALESRDTGKPARQGRADVTATMRYYEFYGGAGDKRHLFEGTWSCALRGKALRIGNSAAQPSRNRRHDRGDAGRHVRVARRGIWTQNHQRQHGSQRRL